MIDDVLLECVSCKYVHFCSYVGSSPQYGESKATVKCRLLFQASRGPVVAIPVGVDVKNNGLIERIKIRNVLINLPWLKRITMSHPNV